MKGIAMKNWIIALAALVGISQAVTAGEVACNASAACAQRCTPVRSAVSATVGVAADVVAAPFRLVDCLCEKASARAAQRAAQRACAKACQPAPVACQPVQEVKPAPAVECAPVAACEPVCKERCKPVRKVLSSLKPKCKTAQNTCAPVESNCAPAQTAKPCGC